MPNLLVFQQLVTLYLGGIHVRVVSERVKKCSRYAKKQGLATGSHRWLAAAGRQMLNTCQACQKLKRHASWSTTEQKVQTDYSVTSRLELATQSSRESKPPASSVLKNLTLRIPFSLQYKYLLYSRNVENFQREYWERNAREKQDWLIHNLHIETFQIPLLSSSPLLHPWEVHYQNIFSSYPHLWEGHLVLGKQLGRDQFTLVDAMVYSGIR